MTFSFVMYHFQIENLFPSSKRKIIYLRYNRKMIATQRDFRFCIAKIQSLRRNNGIRSKVASQTHIVASQSRT